MNENAELYRALREEFRPQRLGFWMAVYGALLGCVLLMMSIEYREGMRIEILASNFLAGLVTFHFVASILLALLRCGSAIAREREMSTLDFQRLTAATPRELAAGKLIGATLTLHVFNALALAMALPAAALAGISIAHTLFVFVLLTGATAFYGALGLLISASHGKGDVAVRSALGMGGFLTVLCAAGTGSILEALTPLPAVTHYFNLAPAKLSSYFLPLAGVAVPVELITLLFYGVGIATLMLGTARQLANPEGPPWTRGQLLAIIGGSLTVLFAFVLSHPGSRHLNRGDLVTTMAIYQSTVLACLVLGGLVLTPSRARVIEETWRGQPGWRELLFGERGTPLPFLFALALMAHAIPAAGLLIASPAASNHLGSAMPLAISGLALTLLALKFCVQSSLWFALTLDYGRVISTVTLLLLVAFGPLLVGMTVIDRWLPWMILLLAGNPPVVFATLAQSHPPVSPTCMATFSILLFLGLSVISCALATRKLAALTVQVESKRRSLHRSE